MVEKGAQLDLGFSVAAIVKGEPWEGLFAALVTGPTVVSVYMRNNTSSCDKQTGQLVEVEPELSAAGIGLVAVSRDRLGSHLKYAAKRGIDFPLVSDPEYSFAQAAGSLVKKRLYGREYFGPARSAYLLDAQGRVLEVIEKVESGRHAAQIRALCQL